jgi:hypothetical protein
MTAMTNHTVPHPGAALDGELLALASIGATRRPVKVVEHPAFGPRRRLRAEAGASSLTVLRLPLVSLDACPRPGRTADAPTTMLEVA